MPNHTYINVNRRISASKQASKQASKHVRVCRSKGSRRQNQFIQEPQLLMVPFQVFPMENYFTSLPICFDRVFSSVSPTEQQTADKQQRLEHTVLHFFSLSLSGFIPRKSISLPQWWLKNYITDGMPFVPPPPPPPLFITGMVEETSLNSTRTSDAHQLLAVYFDFCFHADDWRFEWVNAAAD